MRFRVPTGINGLDELIDGGFEKGKTYLVTGETGTGKTIFSLPNPLFNHSPISELMRRTSQKGLYTLEYSPLPILLKCGVSGRR